MNTVFYRFGNLVLPSSFGSVPVLSRRYGGFNVCKIDDDRRIPSATPRDSNRKPAGGTTHTIIIIIIITTNFAKERVSRHYFV